MLDDARGDQLLNDALTLARDVRTRPPQAVLETLLTACQAEPQHLAEVVMTLALLVDDTEPESRTAGRVWSVVADHHLAGRI